jgi:hypothetical protein
MRPPLTLASAWSEWLPAYQQYTYDFVAAAGDSITATVTATSPTSGTGSLYNARTGQTWSVEMSDQPALCLQTAEWIVEDLMTSDGGFVPFANFGTVSFTQMSATTLGGQTVDATDASLYQMINYYHGTPVASASFTPGGVDVVWISD